MANYTIMSSMRTSMLVKSFSPDSPKVVIPSCFAEFLVSLGGGGRGLSVCRSLVAAVKGDLT